MALELPPLPERTIPRMLQRQAQMQPDAPLLTIGHRHWSHGAAAGAAARRAGALMRAGIVRGDRVATMLTNRLEAIEMFIGCGWMGAISVPINTASKTQQIQYYLENSGARLLVIEDAYLSQLQAADLRQTRLESVWVVGSAAGGAHLGHLKVTQWTEGEIEVEPAAILPSDTLAILYTSGTTGPAKGVLCPHAHYVMFGGTSAQMLELGSGEVLFTTLPLFHINALNTFAQASLTGSHAVIHPRFSASGFWSSASQSGATVIYLLGAMVPMLLAQPSTPQERSHRVRVGLGGGAPAPAADAFRERTGVLLVDGYASTETSIVIAAPPGRRGIGGMGWIRSGFHARVANDLDVEVEQGQAGELLLRADEPFVFANGYFDMPEKTVEAWRNLWFHTGDRVVQESDGSYRFIDRMKDAIRRRGENISSYEVEQALVRHPDVIQAAAFPVPSELAEDDVMVCVVCRPGATLELPDLAAHCESQLPYFAVPRYFDVVQELPKTENGKIQKFKLRDRGVTPSTWERPGAAHRRPGVSQ